MYRVEELSELVRSNLPILRLCTSYMITPAAARVLLEVKDLHLADAITEIALNLADGQLSERAEQVARQLVRKRRGRRQYILANWRDVRQIVTELLNNLQEDETSSV